jgi:hypothetical protein
LENSDSEAGARRAPSSWKKGEGEGKQRGQEKGEEWEKQE